MYSEIRLRQARQGRLGLYFVDTSMPMKFSSGCILAIPSKLSPEPKPTSKFTAPGVENISSNFHLMQSMAGRFEGQEERCIGSYFAAGSNGTDRSM